jgi:hypothetical protein
MKLLALFRNHTHYWGVPHTRTKDDKLVMTCYECGTEREIRVQLRAQTTAPAEVNSNESIAA